MGAGSERCSEAVALLQRCHLQFVNGLDNLVELTLQLLVVADVQVAGQQGVEGLVEVVLGGLQMAGLVVGLSGGVLLLGLRDQGLGRIGFGLEPAGSSGVDLPWERIRRVL